MFIFFFFVPPFFHSLSQLSLTTLRTKEEMAAAQLKIKELIKIKKAERELEEKKRAREAEKKRRESGKGSGTIKEEMAKKQRALMFAQQKKEKQRQIAERERLRREIAKDKAERKARGGMLAGKLSVEGYAPAAGGDESVVAQNNAEKMKQEGINERRKILAEGGVKGFEKIIPREERLGKKFFLSLERYYLFVFDDL